MSDWAHETRKEIIVLKKGFNDVEIEGDWAHETRKQVVIAMLREDPKLEVWLKAFLRIYP